MGFKIMSTILLLSVALLARCSFSLVLPESLARLPGASEMANKTEELVRKHGCDPNVCFALDGSRSISDYEYTLQKDFVKLVASIISADPEGTFSAVQYGNKVERITRRPTSNIGTFLLNVDGSIQRKSFSTRLAPGVRGCISQLDRYRFRFEPKKIVVLGDGQTRYRSSRWMAPPGLLLDEWASGFDERRACAVAVNFEDTRFWERIVGKENVFQVTEWLELLDVVEKLVVDVCGWDALEF